MLDTVAQIFKILIVFFGCGFSTLVGYYAFKEIKTFIKLLEKRREEYKKIDKLQLSAQTKVSPESAFYEISLGNKKRVKIFSSFNGVNVIK